MVKAWRRGRSFVWVMVLIAFFLAADLAVAAPGDRELGFLAGWSFANNDESFNKYDLYGAYGLPWGWQWGQSVQVDTNLVAVASLLDAGDDTAFAGSLGFEFVFGSVSGKFPLELRIGESLTLLEDRTIGEEDFGGLLQFTSHIGFYYRLRDDMRAVVQAQHMSNAGIHEWNPGMNAVFLGVVYRF